MAQASFEPGNFDPESYALPLADIGGSAQAESGVFWSNFRSEYGARHLFETNFIAINDVGD